MTRTIYCNLTILAFLAGSLGARGTINSKRPAAPPPTLLSHVASQTSSAKLDVAKAAAAPVAHLAKKAQALAAKEAEQAATKIKTLAIASHRALGNRLARLTAYWSGEGDYYTRHRISSTGVRLHQGHCAVDPSVIPYGSVVQIPGLGSYLAVDTGTAVISRRAARESGHCRGERNALVVDLYFENRREGEKFASLGPKFAAITWNRPDTVAASAGPAPATFMASEDGRPRSKTL